MRRLTSAVAAGLLVLTLGACGSGGGDEGAAAPGGDGPAAPAPSGGEGGGARAGGTTTDQIEVEDFAFKPEDATTKAGTKVTWIFKDSAEHNVDPVGEAELTKSPDLKNGATYSFTFTQPGTVKYRCSIHNYMTGTVTVVA